MGIMSAGWVSFVFGYKYSNSDGCFFIVRGGGENGIQKFGHFTAGDFVIDF